MHFALSPKDWRPYGKLIERLKLKGVTTSWDLGWRPDAVHLPGFRELYASLDIVFLNRLEAAKFSNESAPEKAARKLAATGQKVVVKLGAEGAISFGPSGIVRSRGMRVRAVDTTGAGDAFNGGYLHAWLDGADVKDCLRTGNACGALSTTKPGGSAAAPNKKELARALGKMK